VRRDLVQEVSVVADDDERSLELVREEVF